MAEARGARDVGAREVRVVGRLLNSTDVAMDAEAAASGPDSG